jgi:hypothetical protein
MTPEKMMGGFRVVRPLHGNFLPGRQSRGTAPELKDLGEDANAGHDPG